MIAISNRLKMIAHKVQENSRLADIGSDHALLPVYLATKQIVPFAIAGEYHIGPLEAAKKQVKQANLNDVIDVRHGDGLAVIAQGEVDCITIAGMGGNLITRILEEGKDKLEGVRQLILQPNVGEDVVRRWLYEHDWYLIEENIMNEDDQIYEIIHAVKAEDAKRLNEELYNVEQFAKRLKVGGETIGLIALIEQGVFMRDDLFRFGPYLLTQPNDILITKWTKERDKLVYICKQLAQASNREAKQRLAQFQLEKAKLKEVIMCLQKVKPSFNG